MNLIDVIPALVKSAWIEVSYRNKILGEATEDNRKENVTAAAFISVEAVGCHADLLIIPLYRPHPLRCVRQFIEPQLVLQANPFGVKLLLNAIHHAVQSELSLVYAQLRH